MMLLWGISLFNFYKLRKDAHEFSNFSGNLKTNTIKLVQKMEVLQKNVNVRVYPKKLFAQCKRR